MNLKYLARVNSTCRSSGAVGKNALIPRLIQRYVSKNKSILDYGAGKNAIHTKKLRRNGYSVTAWDIGENFNPLLHDRRALSRKYDVVMASNVLNIQPSRQKLKETIAQIASWRSTRGIAIVNYSTINFQRG